MSVFSRRDGGFSLVEVVMALGIFIFAIVGIVGLLPVAVETHRKAKVDTVLTQIQQRLAAELLLTDGARLDALASTQRNFDVEGRELAAPEAALTVYSAKLTLNAATLPGGVSSASLRRATLYAVENPAANPDIPTTRPTASMHVAKSESAPAP